MKIKLFAFFIALIFIRTIPATAQAIHFNPIPFRPEKSFEGFFDLTQDSLGYIWLASGSTGIYRYDGNEFINFLHSDSNTNSLGDNRAVRLAVDSSGFIWIGTASKGLDRYDPATNSFAHFRHDPKNNLSLANDTVYAVFIDHSDNLWVGTFNGLDRFNRKTGVFKHYPHNNMDPSSISFNHIRSIYEDQKGIIWIGTGFTYTWFNERPEEGGLNRYNALTDNFTRYVHNPHDSNSLETNKVKALFEDSKGNFWVGSSDDGLHIMDRKKGTFTHFHYDPNHSESLSRPTLAADPADHISFINEDARGRIWIGSYLGGLNIFDPASKKTTHYGVFVDKYDAPEVKKDTASGFSDVYACQALFAKDGTIWITTGNSIVSKYLYSINQNKKTIPYYPVNPHSSNSFYYGPDSILWIGTDSGLIRKDLKLKTDSVYLNNPKNKNSLSNKTINVIRADQEGNMWLGTNGGLNKLNTHTNIFTNYRFDPRSNTGLYNDTIWSMSWDHNQELWIGTINGLNKFNTQTGHFTRYRIDAKNEHAIGINCLREDQNNRMWIAAERGIYYINTNSGISHSVIAGRTLSICVDNKNVVWIGADTAKDGHQILYQFDSKQNQLIAFKDHKTNTIISGVIDIMEDNKYSLWITTTDAIIKIDNSRNSVTKYGRSYGVLRHFNYYGDNYKAKSGLLFFGYTNGYYSFYPEELKDDPLPKLNFTSFKLNGTEVIPSTGSILTEPIWKTSKIRLPFNQNSFSFDFLSINYLDAGVVKYSFLLENYDKTWRNYSAEQVANYNDVKPGDYVFRVKAFNENGNWVEKSITIIISPPWWKTWWAYSIFALLFVSGVWGFIYYRSRQLRRENRVLEEKVTLRTAQLNKSLLDLKSTQSQLVQSEKMASLGELTAGIAHEIQNPLNFVNNFSDVNKELIDEMRGEIANRNFEEVELIATSIKENEEKINHHGKRADAIVKGMLQHSRSNTGIKELTDLNALADEYLRLCYHGLRAKDKTINARMITDFDPAIGKIDVIPQDIGRVFLNLFNNAFYSVTERKKEQGEGFDPTVSVLTRKKGTFAQITIKDNGTGIPKNIIDKIMQPFFTTKPAGSGTGLGLSLSYDIIKSHGGELKIESVEGESAAFIISLPLTSSSG